MMARSISLLILAVIVVEFVEARASATRFRLPQSFRPIIYDVKLTLSSTTEEIIGQVRIELQCVEASSLIQLHANPVFITVNYFHLQHGFGNHSLNISRGAVDGRHKTVTFNVSQPLEKGHVYFLSLWFKTRYSTGQKGFVQTLNGRHGTWMNTLLETSHAREILPCFDEPHWRAIFKLKLWLQGEFASRNFTALSNTKGTKQAWNEQLSIWTFEPTPPIPTYLFAVTVGRLSSVCQFRHEISREICVWRFADSEGWHATAVQVISSMTLYQQGMLDYLLVDPLSRLHLLVVPSKLNGMENFGLLNIKEALWPRHNDVNSFNKFCKTLFHEMAHQWFGNLVTMRWWDDIWLSESITTFLSTRRPIVFDSNFDLSTDPLISDLWADGIPHMSYTKGAALLEMLDSVIGAHQMRRVLRDYLRKFQFGVASTPDFLEILGAVTANHTVDMVDFLSTWLHQGSHPIVFIDYDITLKRFIFTQAPKVGDPTQRWPIPIWMRCHVGTKTEQLHWLSKTEQLQVQLDEVTSTGSPDAVIFNHEKSVYYQLSFRYRK